MSENIRAILSFAIFVAVGLSIIGLITYFSKKRQAKSFRAILKRKYIKAGTKPGETPTIPKYRLAFIISDKDRKRTVEFFVNENQYQHTPENVYGTLVLQGMDLISFVGRDFKIDYTN